MSKSPIHQQAIKLGPRAPTQPALTNQGKGTYACVLFVGLGAAALELNIALCTGAGSSTGPGREKGHHCVCNLLLGDSAHAGVFCRINKYFFFLLVKFVLARIISVSKRGDSKKSNEEEGAGRKSNLEGTREEG
jgi:hypothetical protein